MCLPVAVWTSWANPAGLDILCRTGEPASCWPVLTIGAVTVIVGLAAVVTTTAWAVVAWLLVDARLLDVRAGAAVVLGVVEPAVAIGIAATKGSSYSS